MGVVQTGAIYKGFTFDGINSKTYGVYISGEAVYNSPERDVEMIEIPGRNGAFALDKGRFTNITVTYPAGLFGDSEADFAQGISDLRNALASRKGYCRLEDEYNPTEYRLAVYRSGLDVDSAQLKAGEFEIVFDCKPQRFLKSGEIPCTIGGSITSTQTKSGTVVSIDSDGGDKAASLVATIEAVQAGSGDPSPTNVRAITGWTAANVTVAGKNLYRPPDDDSERTIGNATFIARRDGSVIVSNSAPNSQTASYNLRYTRGVLELPKGVPLKALGGIPNKVQVRICYAGVDNVTVEQIDPVNMVIPDNAVTSWVRVSVYRNFEAFDPVEVKPLILLATETNTAYEPYTGATTTTALGRTVYGGTVDVVTGVLTVTHKAVDLGTMAWTLSQASGTNYFRSSVLSGAKITANGQTSAMCSAYKPISGTSLSYFLSQNNVAWTAPSNISTTNPYACIRDERYSDAAAFKTAVSGVLLVYELATPQTYQLTAQQVELLAGQNNVWADTGDISITYGHDPNKLVNPTLFEAHPLLEVDGYGTISINGEEVVLHNEPVGRVQLGGGTSYKNTITYTFDQTQFNTGDFITVPDCRRTFQFDMVKPYGSGEIIDFQVTSMTAPDYIFSATKYQGTLTLLTDASIFSVGTARTDSYNVVGKISYKNSSGTASEADFRAGASVAYDGNGSVTFTAFKFATDASFVYTTVAGNAPNFYGDSTWQPVTDTAYIDLDIGEAYVINDGAVIGINNIVDLPAELPTLKAGANTITYDNTFSQLKIVPRWWRI